MTGRRAPRLPGLLAAPFALFPSAVHSRLLAATLGYVLKVALKNGELDFLRGRNVSIKVQDMAVNWHLTLAGTSLLAGHRSSPADLVIEAALYDFLMLIDHQEDPDTLVFQRRLVMEGDTELGLQIKNFLDGLELESLCWYRPPATLLRKALPVYARLFR